MSLRPLEPFHFFQIGDRLYTSESGVYRRQILTYKDDPRAERVKSPFRQIKQRPRFYMTLIDSVT